MIVPGTARFFFIIMWGQKSYGDRRDTVRAESQILETPQGHRTGSSRFLIKVCGYPTFLRSPYGSDSERRRKPEPDIIR